MRWPEDPNAPKQTCQDRLFYLGEKQFRFEYAISKLISKIREEDKNSVVLIANEPLFHAQMNELVKAELKDVLYDSKPRSWHNTGLARDTINAQKELVHQEIIPYYPAPFIETPISVDYANSGIGKLSKHRNGKWIDFAKKKKKRSMAKKSRKQNRR